MHGLGSQGTPVTPDSKRGAGSPFLQFPRDLRAGDDTQARLELRAREGWEPGWKGAGLNVRV